jgi:hypothetical protein
MVAPVIGRLAKVQQLVDLAEGALRFSGLTAFARNLSTLHVW